MATKITVRLRSGRASRALKDARDDSAWRQEISDHARRELQAAVRELEPRLSSSGPRVPDVYAGRDALRRMQRLLRDLDWMQENRAAVLLDVAVRAAPGTGEETPT
jgi:hypothetical protein